MPTSPPTTLQRLETVRSQPLLDALRSHDGHPKGVCRHVDDDEPWVDQTVTVASVVMNLEKLRLHVAAGPPCTPRARARSRCRRPLLPSARIDSSAVSAERPDDHGQRQPDRDVPDVHQQHLHADEARG